MITVDYNQLIITNFTWRERQMCVGGWWWVTESPNNKKWCLLTTGSCVSKKKNKWDLERDKRPTLSSVCLCASLMKIPTPALDYSKLNSLFLVHSWLILFAFINLFSLWLKIIFLRLFLSDMRNVKGICGMGKELKSATNNPIKSPWDFGSITNTQIIHKCA